VIHAVPRPGLAGLDALSGQFIAPRSPGVVAVSAAVYLVDGWIVGGHLAARRSAI
jgi:hypothetical protein